MLAVDQFEELFTACQDEARARRVRRRARARRARDGDGVVVLAVRADFYGRCAAYPELSRLLGANHVLVGPMSRDELRRAIERPAQRVGPERRARARRGAARPTSRASRARCRCCRPRCSSCGASATGGACASPPTRAAAASRAPSRGSPRTRSSRSTRRSRRWRASCCCASPTRTRAARSCAGGSRSPSSSAERDRRGRRPAHRPPPADGRPTAPSRSRTRRCCASGRGCAPGWRRTSQGRRLHRQLGDAARAWDADARDPGGLYRGARLASALDWAADHDPELNATERAFLDDSRRASGRAQRRLRLGARGRGRAARRWP